MPRRRPAGSTVRLSVERWDGDLPVVGDMLRTDAGRCYRIERVSPGVKRLAILVCTVLEDDAVQFGEPGVFRWHFSRRGPDPDPDPRHAG